MEKNLKGSGIAIGSILELNSQHFGARTLHGTWFATSFHLGLVFRASLTFPIGLVFVFFRVGFRVRVYSGSIQGWRKLYLRVGLRSI